MIALTEGKEGAETIGNPRHDREGLVRFRIHPATIPPMPSYWWNTESMALRAKAEARRNGFSVTQRRLWKRIAGHQLGTKCLRGVVVSGHVVDFFIPEARLIIDSAPSPRFLGHSLLWLTVHTEDIEQTMTTIQRHVTERAGIVAYDPLKTYDIPSLPPCGSARMSAMIDAALHQRQAA